VLTFCMSSAAASPADLVAAAAGPVSSGFMAGNSNTSCATENQFRAHSTAMFQAEDRQKTTTVHGWHMHAACRLPLHTRSGAAKMRPTLWVLTQ
jgi:hypothetical protein